MGKQISNLYWTLDLTALRIYLGVASLLWSILLFWPGETFDRPTYALMAQVATEPIWATLFGLHGCVVLLSVFNHIIDTKVIILDGALGCILWTFSCIAMLLSVYPPPAAISAEIVAALASWWVLSRYPSEVT